MSVAHDSAWEHALAGQRFGPTAKVVPMAAPPGSVGLGTIDGTDGTLRVDLVKLIAGRLLIQGNSGAGKSWTLRRLLEQTAKQIQQIVIDPEGEFATLAERFGHVTLEAHRLDGAALAIAAARAREHRLSVVLDLSHCERSNQLQAAAAFLTALIEAPREHWTPAIVAIDEAQLFAPSRADGSAGSAVIRKESITAMADLMGRGRKRGLCAVLATLRLARLATSVASEAQNFLVGLSTLDLDIRRAAETIGWDARRAFDRLPLLKPGEFVASGGVFSQSPAIVRVGAVETEHRGAAPALVRPAAITPSDASQLLELESLIEASSDADAVRQEATVSPGYRAVRAFIRDPAFVGAARIFGALRELAPEGARVDELGPYLEIDAEGTAAALALLDQFAIVEFLGDEDRRAVRLAKGSQ
jgi:hypothetical protein